MEIAGKNDVPITDDRMAIDDWINKGRVSGYVFLYNRYFDSIYFHCLRIGQGDEELAKDVTQEIFTELLHQKKEYIKDVNDVRYYLSAWSRNRLRRIIKKRAKNLMTEKEYFFSELMEMNWKGVFEEHVLYQKNIHELFQEFRSLLSQRQQQVFFLQRVQGLSLAEVAEQLSMKYNTAKKHSFSAMTIIKNYVDRSYSYMIATFVAELAFIYTFTITSIDRC